MAPTPHTPSLSPNGPIPGPSLNWAFLARTVRSTVVTAALIGLMVAVYHSIPLGARYLFFALWSLAFFTSTGLIFKHLLFNQSRIKGLAAVAFKLGLLVLVYAVLFGWPIPGSEHERAHMIAMVAGVTTPIFVLVLRALAWAMDQNKRDRQRAATSASPAPNPRSGASSGVGFKMQA